MKLKQLLALSFVAAVAACSDASTPTQAIDPNSVDLSVAESMGFDFATSTKIKVFPTVQVAQAAQQKNAGIFVGPPVLYHAGGRVIPLPRVAAVYWSNAVIYNGGPAPGTSGLGSADGSMIGKFMRTMGGTPFWSINHEYTDNVAGAHSVSLNLSYTRFYANNVGAPGPGANVSDAAIRAMLAATVGTANLPFDQQTIYAVFSGTGVNLGGGFGTQYCAYHGFFPRPGFPGTWIIYSAQPRDADFTGTGCTAVNTPATGSPTGDFAADATINVLSHEIEEAATDPGLNAWFDAFGQENADKCAWTFLPTFPATLGGQANVTFSGQQYLIQRNWRLGPNLANQVGCTLS